jgi:HTH-type transcriptional regulator/antitoxin HigA
VNDDDDRHYSILEMEALEVIKIKMQETGMKNKDLEPIIGSKGHVSAILSVEREIILKMAVKIKNYFGIPAKAFLYNA